MIKLYFHGGSANHGCEAIVRATQKIINKNIRLYSSAVDEDKRYGLSDIVEVRKDEEISPSKNSINAFLSSVYYKLFKSDYYYIRVSHKEFVKDINEGDVYLSIGGDNYCYSGVDKLAFYNRFIKSKGAKTVLWGCSIEPDILKGKVVEDLKQYDLITVRETLSYEGLKNAGITDNVMFCSDPAFQLDMKPVQLPIGVNDKAIGINVSPLVLESGNLVFENYIKLIEYIISNTDYSVLLIPHVVKKDSDDRSALKELYKLFINSNRVYMIEDMDCQRLKGVISQCSFFVGARTHATIAAYSTCVPTLVVGYSVKSKGIAKDIFGTYENYVVQANELLSDDKLVKSFMWIENNEIQIRKHLERIIPKYKQKAIVNLNSIMK